MWIHPSSQKYTDKSRPNTYLLNVFLHLLQWKGLSFALCVLIWYRSPGELVNTLSQPSCGQYRSFWPLGPISTCPLLYSNISLGAFGFINMISFSIVWSKCFSHSPSNKNNHCFSFRFQKSWKMWPRKIVGNLFGNFPVNNDMGNNLLVLTIGYRIDTLRCISLSESLLWWQKRSRPRPEYSWIPGYYYRKFGWI